MSKRTESHRTPSRLPAYVSGLGRNDGEALQVSFDLQKAPVPQKTYTAEYCGINRSPNGNIVLVFSDANPTTGKPNHSLCVLFSDISFLNLWENSKTFIRAVQKYVSTVYGPVEATPPMIAEINQSMWANMAFMGHQGAELILAFYNFDPRTARNIAQGYYQSSDMWVEPVVQVKTSVMSALPMIQEFESIVEDITRRYPKLKEVLKEELQNAREESQ